MAITTMSALKSGLKPPFHFFKTSSTSRAAGTMWSSFYASGDPPAAAVPSPGMAGESLTSHPAQIRFDNPVSGNAYLARFDGPWITTSGSSSTCQLCDRLWQNSGIDVTSTSAQTIDSVAWPARDRNGSTDGEGVLIGIEVSTTTGNASFIPSITLTYTNSAGTSGRSGVMGTFSSLVTAGTIYLFPLQAGDIGVRSVQSITISDTMTSGVVHLVALRVIADALQSYSGNNPLQDAISTGLPRMYNNSVPFIIQTSGQTAVGAAITIQYAHG